MDIRVSVRKEIVKRSAHGPELIDSPSLDKYLESQGVLPDSA